MPLGGQLVGWGPDYRGPAKVRQELPDGTVLTATSSAELEAAIEAHFEDNPESKEVFDLYQTKAAPNGNPDRVEPDEPDSSGDGSGGGGA